MKKISLIFLITIFLSGCGDTMPDQKNDLEETSETPSTQETTEVDENGLQNNSEEATETPATQNTSEEATETPATQNTSETDENGLVNFQEGDINLNFNLNNEQIIPNFDLSIGKVSDMKLSPNKRFLYITTAQGGDTASFIYSIEKNEVHFLGNEIKGVGEWQEDGKLKVVNKEVFGENIGEVSSIYESDNSGEPWKLSKK